MDATLAATILVFTVLVFVLQYRNKRTAELSSARLDALVGLQKDYDALLKHANGLAREKVLTARIVKNLVAKTAKPPAPIVPIIRERVENGPIPESLIGKTIDDFVAVERRVREEIEGTVEKIQQRLNRRLTGSLDEAPLDVAAHRLESTELAVDTTPGLSVTIVTAKE